MHRTHSATLPCQRNELVRFVVNPKSKIQNPKSIPRRSFVLIAVLVVVIGAILLTTSVLFMTQGRVADAGTNIESAQHRLLAWSGAQAVMSRLNDQRDRFLAGELPQLDRQYTLYETAGRLGVVRLLPMTADGQVLFSAESGKIDLNGADAESLARTGLVDIASAQAIVNYRDHTLGRPFQSESELLNIPDGIITPEKLYGPIDEIKPRDQSEMAQADLAERVQARLASPDVRGLADMVTVYAVEPALQAGGVLRINLNVSWSDELADKVRRRFGDDAAQVLKAIFEQGTKFDNDSKIVQVLRTLNVEPQNWREILDTFTTESGEDHFGRLNLNTASVEALMSLPGVTPEQAAELVSARQQLSGDNANTIVWPVLSQIISPEAFEPLAGRLTTRCWTYRVRLAAGEVSADEPEGPLNNPIIVEAVIDLSSPNPRVAYLRDISVLQAAAQIALQSTANQSVEFESSASSVETSAEETSSPQPNDAAEADTEDAAGAEAETSADETQEPADDPTDDSPASGSSDTASAPASGAASGTASSSAPNARRKVGRWIGGG